VVRRGLLHVVVVIAATVEARAQSAQDQAEILFEEGRDLLEKHEPAKACARFERAIRLDPGAAGIMLNLGVCNEALGKYKSALYWYRKAEHRATEGDHPMPSHERVAKERAAVVATKVATVKIAFSSEPPPGIAVAIDGEPVAPDDYARVEIDPGNHVLKAEAPGLATTRPFRVDDTTDRTIMVVLAPATKPAAPSEGGHRGLGLSLAIGGVAALAAAGGIALYEQRIYTRCTTNGVLDTSAAGCDHRTDPYAAAVEANHALEVTRIYGTSLTVVGAAAVAVGAYLYLQAPARRERAAIAPALGRDHIGIVLVGDL
jgi:hypothetical protein